MLVIETYLFPVLVFAGLGLLSAVLLTYASKVFAVETDERAEQVNEALPQANCGACGFSGCADYAAAIVAGRAELNLCRPGGSESAEKIGIIMGMDAGDVEPQVAVVLCSGDCSATGSKYIFQGYPSCAAANRFYNGSETCTHGCLGFGDCTRVCANDAIRVVDGLARIDKTRCAGCGLCVKECPNSLIVVKKLSNLVDVRCSSTDPGKMVRTICKSGCIGCKICEKKCEAGAIKVENNIARIDYSKCTSCGACAEACPQKVIIRCNA